MINDIWLQNTDLDKANLSDFIIISIVF